MSEATGALIAKLLLQNLFWVAGMGALLCLAAGTLHWPALWVFLSTVAISGVGCGAWLGRVDPALLAERMRPVMQADQPAADKIFMLVFGCASFAWFMAMGSDRRTHASDMPLALQALGLAAILATTGFILWVMRENSFAAPVVKVQAERGHHVVSTGPYAWVRHPMYSGGVLFCIGAALLLGSWWGVLMTPAFAVLFAIRIGTEERTLTTELPDYADYAARVRYRLFPGVW